MSTTQTRVGDSVKICFNHEFSGYAFMSFLDYTVREILANDLIRVWGYPWPVQSWVIVGKAK